MRPQPRAEGPTAPYWQALRRREFLLPYDARAGRFRHPIEALSGATVEWVPAPREGHIMSYSWIHLPTEGYTEVPYVLATVALDDGPQLMCNIVDADADEIDIG
ncbi:Zn-ribbon domain-containing OB-fold protein, partial [Actinomadura sp. LOL_016]